MAATVTVNGNTIDSAAGDHTYRDASGSDFIYIKAHDVLTNDQKQELTSLGVEIQEYISDHTYMCHYRNADLEPIRRLSYVQTANVYEPAMKTTESLKHLVEVEDDKSEYEIDIYLHSDSPASPEQVASEISQRTGVNQDSIQTAPGLLRLTVNQSKLGDIETIDSVNRIEEVRPVVPMNDYARRLLLENSDYSSVGKPMFSFYYKARNQVVSVCDTGMDTSHKAFWGKIRAEIPTWYTPVDDPNGHGTHCAGSVIGGTAPEAKLLAQSIWMKYASPQGGGLQTPFNRTDLFTRALAAGATVSTNSWGTPYNPQSGQLGYDAGAAAADWFVNRNQDFVILIAAGNDGSKNNFSNEVGGHSIAKNIITVGATVSSRPNDGFAYNPYYISPDAKRIARFSSRGPSLGSYAIPGRIKPDVVAPGTAILSAASHQIPQESRQMMENGNGKWYDPEYIFMAGTSMATPLVAGCTAVIREALQSSLGGNLASPSASLVKAILINGTLDLKGYYPEDQRTIPAAPNGEQGFGRVDLANSLLMTEPNRQGIGFVDAGDSKPWGAPRSLGPYQSWWSSPISIGWGKVFKATLVYPDPEGERLQNNLNLIVRSGYNELHGNTNDAIAFDQVNNVEKVVWENPPTSVVSIEVRVNGITAVNGRQSFAVAWMTHY